MLDKIQVIALLETGGIGRRTVFSLIKRVENPSASISDLHEALLEITRKRRERFFLPLRELEFSFKKAERITKGCKRGGIQIIRLNDADFPERLRDIPDPPVILYVKGDLDCMNPEAAIAVVGTRRPTALGRKFSGFFGQVLAKKEVVVVSGLALGCDAAAHEGCLEAKGQTVAFLPSGLSRVYPSQNEGLARRILRFSGCLASEYAPMKSPENYYFIERDRLQSGLSDGVVVVETDVEGGAMHTARFCLEEKKPLACLEPRPPHADHPMVQGNLKLIREKKAIPLKNTEDFQQFVKLSRGLRSGIRR